MMKILLSWIVLASTFSPIPRHREKSYYEVDFGELGTGTGIIDETLWPNVVQDRKRSFTFLDVIRQSNL